MNPDLRPTIGALRGPTAARARLAQHEASRAAPVCTGQFLRVGDSVDHKAFGEGVVVAIEGSGARCEAVICFEHRHLKRLLLSWSPITKSTPRESKGEYLLPVTAQRRRPRLDSPLEEAFYDALPRYMQEEVVTQFEVGRYRLDFAFVEEKLCVEVDGRAYHSKDEAFARDRSRDRWLTANGWRVIRFASDEVFSDAKRCVDEVIAMRRNA